MYRFSSHSQKPHTQYGSRKFAPNRAPNNQGASTSRDHNYEIHGGFSTENYVPPTFNSIDEGWYSGQTPTETPQTMRVLLLATVCDQDIDTWAASRIILQSHESGQYNADEYKLFLKDPKLSEIKSFDDGTPLLPIELEEDVPRFFRLQVIQNKLTRDIEMLMLAKSSNAIMKCRNRLTSELDLRKCRELPFSLSNLQNNLLIPEDDIFKALDLKLLMTSGKWKTQKHSPLDKIYSAVKFILAQSTKNPSDIQLFSVSVGDAPLRIHDELPFSVCRVIYDFIMQVTGFNSDFFSESPDVAQANHPTKWLALGSDNSERHKSFTRLTALKDSIHDARGKIVADQLNELRRCSLGQLDNEGTAIYPKRKRLPMPDKTQLS